MPTLDIDDAFGSDDEGGLRGSFKLDADTIRRDIALHEPTWSAHDDPDESVSTLDIDGPSRSVTPPTVDDDDMDGEFSQISLSEPNTAVELEPPPDIPTEAPYPSVIIDASESRAHRSSPSTSSDAGSSVSHTSASPPQPATAQSSQPELPETHSSPNPEPPSTTAPPLPVVVPPPQKPTHRSTRSTGPSVLEKVRSRTRPHHLPPKPRDEDNKHLSEWQAIMKLSRAAAEKRRKALHERRMAREKKIEDSLSIWEKEIVPDFRVVYKNPALRRLWWQGIPTRLRASLWASAVGNSLALSKDNYKACLTRAKRALSAGAFPAATLVLIDEDIGSTLPSLHIFHHETGPLYSDLKDMMCAWVVSRSDEGLGYIVGAARIAAMLLINMPPERSFIVFRNLLERHCMRSFFGGESSKDDVDAYYRIFDTLLADAMPKIYFNFKQHLITPSAYLPQWLVPLFLDHLPFEACARIWDVIVLEGDSFLYRASLGIMAVLEPRLFFPDRNELLELLRGENKAALDVARREDRPLNGGKYEIYGVDEETLWERIDGMHDWWKDSTWQRLIQRELPDL
ncbi:Tbc1 domain family member 14 [Mycena kentingensis (nom. inval.)]|nr:Tbc1 domain family member 14 [Mycena kentingensis (nom. inval.)]